MADIEPTCNPIDPLLIQKEDVSREDSKINQTQQPPHFTNVDSNHFDIVRATQYGVYDRCRELIETGYNVNMMDRENVSLLHWAAINNRTELVTYYVEIGAVVDCFGGDLNSTPLHWATRQGHLSMVVLLMSYGADPSLRDGEGCSGIHLASQFGHTAIVAYLIAKGQDVDMVDKNGMTPLMWSCYRVFSYDPTRLLLTFDASINKQDGEKGNTPLHWASLTGNTVAVSLLLEFSAKCNITNIMGQTAYDIAHGGKHSRLATRLYKEMLRNKEQAALPCLSSLYTSNKRTQQWVTGIFPFLTVFFIGFVLELTLEWWWKLMALVLYCISWRFIGQYFFVQSANSVLPVATYVGTKFLLYVTWFVYYWPYVSTWKLMLPWTLNTIFLAYNFSMSMFTDPGFICSSRSEKISTILDLAESQSLTLTQFCSSCIVRRPIRSKHCSVCNKCVAKFDHHCPWVYNCVGANNHKYFLGFLLFLSTMLIWSLYGSYIYWIHVCPWDLSIDGVSGVLHKITQTSPWVFWMACNSLVHLIWAGAMLLCQLYQVMFLAMTTNERMNAYRYVHFHTDIKGKHSSPFHRGLVANLLDVVGWRCFGFYRSPAIDWTQKYTLQESVSDDVFQKHMSRLSMNDTSMQQLRFMNRENYQTV